jgi:hypothetical protein
MIVHINRNNFYFFQFFIDFVKILILPEFNSIILHNFPSFGFLIKFYLKQVNLLGTSRPNQAIKIGSPFEWHLD